ncbi:MAG: PAS domain S-box protein, partial [Bdellovibrionota bacterium]
MMTKAKTTKTEAGRLQALYRYDILDTSEDPNFNDLVALAAATCKMPMAAINFVESERTWTKAKVGLNLVEQHRRFSICAQTILQNDTMVIADLQADERFSKYDLVTGESKLRFYAGAPLVNSDGYAIGTLCVMSNEPSAMSAEQQVSLRAIARQVVTQLELRHRLAREVHVKRDLDLNNELEFSTVFENLPHGIAKLNSEAKFIQANSAFLRLLGYSKEELCGMTEYDLTHAQDLNPLSDVARCFRDAHFRNSKIQKRYVAKDGSIVWTQVSGIRVDGDDENDDCVLLAIEDIGTIKALEAESQSMVDSLEQARRLASEKSQQLEDLFENMNEGVLLQDESARIVQLNRAAMEILGLNAEEMAGRFALDPHWNARRSDGQPLAADEHPIAVALKTGKPQLQYPIIVKKKEANAHLTINAVPLFRKGQEKPHGVLCTFSDLTQLQATKIELENTLNVIPAGLYRTDVNGKCTYVNRNWCELSGMGSEESVQSGWMGNIHPDDQERVTVEWTATLTGGHQFETVYRLLRSDGTIAHVQASASTVSDVGGVPGGYLRSIQDITSLREAEILNAFYKTSLDTAAIVAFTDGKGRITYANNMFCEISGHSREELIGSRHRMIDSGLSGKFPTKEMWESSEGPKKWHGEICGRAKNGSEYWVATTVVPVIGVDGKAERFMSLGRDVTQQKRQQQELAEAYRKAELATNAKSDFLSTMSHEIRTPLNGVIGMTSLLQESKLTAEQAEYVDAISSSGTILLSIINDILDFSKIEAGKVDIEQTEFDLESYIKELIRPLQYPAQKKGIILNYESSNYSHRVLGDDGKIGQIVTNLVSNAIKFTSTGSVLVRTRLEAV